MIDEGLDEIVKAAWRKARGPLVGASDGQTYVVPALTNDLMRDICRAAITAYLSASAEPVAWRHKKRGGLYEIVGEAQVQTNHPLEDYELVVVYRSLNTPDIDDPKSPMKGELWARPKAEFYDGRFEEAPNV